MIYKINEVHRSFTPKSKDITSLEYAQEHLRTLKGEPTFKAVRRRQEFCIVGSLVTQRSSANSGEFPKRPCEKTRQIFNLVYTFDLGKSHRFSDAQLALQQMSNGPCLRRFRRWLCLCSGSIWRNMSWGARPNRYQSMVDVETKSGAKSPAYAKSHQQTCTLNQNV